MPGEEPTRPAGAADRTTFLELQARNRRATWKLTAACALVVGAGSLLDAFGFIGGVGLVLFAVTFVPAVVLFGLGFLALLTPVTALLDTIAGGLLPWWSGSLPGLSSERSGPPYGDAGAIPAGRLSNRVAAAADLLTRPRRLLRMFGIVMDVPPVERAGPPCP